jgi:hypothetical protein
MSYDWSTTTIDRRSPGDRDRNIARTLRILRGVCGGRITPAQIGHRESWSPRAVMSYLRALETAGHAEPVQQLPGRETTWRITQAGKTHLQDVTGGLNGSKFEVYPATQERDQ